MARRASGWISERARNEALLRNAKRQAAYRERHLKDPDTVDSERLNMVVPLTTKHALKRLAIHYGVTQREMLAQVMKEAERKLLDTMTGRQQEAYYDAKR